LTTGASFHRGSRILHTGVLRPCPPCVYHVWRRPPASIPVTLRYDRRLPSVRERNPGRAVHPVIPCLACDDASRSSCRLLAAIFDVSFVGATATPQCPPPADAPPSLRRTPAAASFPSTLAMIQRVVGSTRGTRAGRLAITLRPPSHPTRYFAPVAACFDSSTVDAVSRPRGAGGGVGGAAPTSERRHPQLADPRCEYALEVDRKSSSP